MSRRPTRARGSSLPCACRSLDRPHEKRYLLARILHDERRYTKSRHFGPGGMTQLTLSSPTDRTAVRPDYPSPTSSSPADIRILIIEDEETLRESCASVLSHDGYDVTTIGVAREAQNLLRHNLFDVVLMDWYMSDIPGAELLPLALAGNPATRVIAVTGKPTLASS